MLGRRRRQGLKIALSALDSGRVGVAAQSVGVAQAALDASRSPMRGSAVTFGKAHRGPPGDQHFELAEMATQDRGRSRQMYLHAASLKDARAVPSIKEASMAKLFASEMARER